MLFHFVLRSPCTIFAQKNIYMSNLLSNWLLFMLFFLPAVSFAQEEYPSAEPTMTIIANDGSETEDVSFDGSAPMHARFQSHPTNVGNYYPFCEWRFIKEGEEKPFLIRYDEDTEYTFQESGSFSVELYISFVQGSDTIEFVMEEPYRINISESKFELPNAFTPNGDGINDIFKVKEGYESIVSFEAKVFNRWGKKLYEWSDLEGGWDGKSGGTEVPDGAYYLIVKARGADGKKYDTKKVINILRGYTEKSSE